MRGLKRIIALFAVVAGVTSCSVEKKAARAYRQGEYEKVIDLYRGVLARSPNHGPANYYLAESYRLSNRIRQAEPYYKKASGKGIDPDSVQFFYSQALEANGKYEEAKGVLEKLIPQIDNDDFKARIEDEINGINYLEEIMARPNYYRVKNLEDLNTQRAEYSPVYLNNELYFVSARATGKVYLGNGTPFTEIYSVRTQGARVDMSTVKPLPGAINLQGVNEGSVSFSPDGKTMVFARGNTGKKKGTFDVDLYISRFRNDVWSEPTPININDPLAWDSSPAFSPDGRTLYFSSNRTGPKNRRIGYGGNDLYAATMDTRGRFTRVRNLGPEINTPGHEMFPYLAEDGKLYFASDGHPGFGNLDLFVVKRANGRTTVENLGQPVNSTGDDFGIFLFRPDRGFFTSNRDGGKGDDDIYTFVNEDPNLKVVNYFLQGITYAPNSSGTLEILPNTRVSLLSKEGDVVSDYITGNDGKFFFRVYENENYELMGEREGYLTEREHWSTVGKSVPVETLKELVTNITFDTVVVLDKIELNKIFVLQNIYYEFAKYDIRADAAVELDKLVQLLNDNPEIKIELSSHTDSVDTYEFNLVLSQRRAESAVNYMIRKGIAPDRMIAKGYGESRPIARNTNPDGTDNPEGRQRNRRTEFKILEVGVIPQRLKTDDDFDEDKFFKNDNDR
jgi:outer membrane protein OmpA-like peptidoglycan-associated protein